ncbi:MAG: H+transporting two-sector ATPase subunit [Acidobacteriaceae bacterium]|nr:H+transporting two-sector ATPase subunit [Acidobacteriaceae bacterium]
MKIVSGKSLLAALVLLAGLMMPMSSAHAQSSEAPAAAARQTSTPESASPEANKAEKDENDAYLHSPSVKAIGAKLGMSTEQAATAFQVANFAVLAVLVGWFLIKTLPGVFRDRNTTIQKDLVDARTATEEASVRLNSVEERLSKLDGQIAAMRTQAENDAASEEQRIKASVEDETKKIMASAEQEIAAATTHAQRQIQQYAAELAIDQAAKKLVVSAETDRLLVQSFARRLAGDDSKEGQN